MIDLLVRERPSRDRLAGGWLIGIADRAVEKLGGGRGHASHGGGCSIIGAGLKLLFHDFWTRLIHTSSYYLKERIHAAKDHRAAGTEEPMGR